LRFRDLVVGVDEKLEVIVRFLAVLELFKQGIVDLEQAENFAELVVRPLAAGERATLDLASIEDWEDDAEADESRRRALRAAEVAAAEIEAGSVPQPVGEHA
jgi:segregation and condensation protein A